MSNIFKKPIKSKWSININNEKLLIDKLAVTMYKNNSQDSSNFNNYLTSTKVWYRHSTINMVYTYQNLLKV